MSKRIKSAAPRAEYHVMTRTAQALRWLMNDGVREMAEEIIFVSVRGNTPSANQGSVASLAIHQEVTHGRSLGSRN